MGRACSWDGNTTDACNIFVVKSDGKRPYGRSQQLTPRTTTNKTKTKLNQQIWKEFILQTVVEVQSPVLQGYPNPNKKQIS
jgi:hypothetical protein